jgi:cytochrome P450
MVGTAILLFAAGYETTTNLLGNGLYALLTHPTQMTALQQQPCLIPRGVEELLRYDPPAQLTGRTVLQPCTVTGWVAVGGGEQQ